MRKLFFYLCFFFPSSYSFAQTSPAVIFQDNRDAVVQIFVNGVFHGNGFIISKDGFIATANHVVATEESDFMEYASAIRVLVPKHGEHSARKITPITKDSKNWDSAILKIELADLPFVKMGSLEEVHVADSVSIIATWPTIGEILLFGQVSEKGLKRSMTGPLPVNVIFIQAPIRKGFSGAPIFSNTTGNVVGIITTKFFKLSPELDAARKDLAKTHSDGIASMGNVDLGAFYIKLIDSIESDLISDLGSAVDISYAKQMSKETKDTLNYRKP